MTAGERPKALLAWSTGKDSALALHTLLAIGQYELCALLTTVTEDYGRVSMHGVRESLLDRQAVSLELALAKVHISKDSDMEEYETRMRRVLERYRQMGVSSVAFGDIYLEDLREYRERKLDEMGMKAIFPIWKKGTAELAREFIALGFKSVITCVDSRALGKTFVGRTFDETFLRDLPAGVDPCGENGEFHSFVYDGPTFREPVTCETGEIVLRNEHFYFCDLT